MSLNNQHAERLREMAKEPRRKAEAARRDQKENHDGGYLALAVMSSLAADSYELDAAALLAGAEALERLEAMESTSSTMLPKSTSVSEEACECALRVRLAMLSKSVSGSEEQ